ncbi:hypothetical protein DEJ15_06675 [Curtobacterium sp. MCJR17_043]|nr:hypothetical protein [Curtobacterium sp. MCJR17_043]WIB36726.1 hypothetical protein DEJ15_06675 [Curtobacterium sp. MCJR17_043]
MVGLFTAAKRFVERTPDAPARVFVDDLLGADLPEDSIGPDRTAGRVRVLTPSATVGLECDVVVVTGLQDGVWPNTRVRGSLLDPDGLVRAAAGVPHSPTDDRAAVIGDELRLFARAVSRATTQVVIATVANDDESPSPFVRLVPVPPDRQPSAHPLSLRGLAGSLRRRVVATGDSEAASALARLAAEDVPGGVAGRLVRPGRADDRRAARRPRRRTGGARGRRRARPADGVGVALPHRHVRGVPRALVRADVRRRRPEPRDGHRDDRARGDGARDRDRRRVTVAAGRGPVGRVDVRVAVDRGP